MVNNLEVHIDSCFALSLFVVLRAANITSLDRIIVLTRHSPLSAWSVSQSTVQKGGLTGDAGVDNDIMAFMRAREAILRRSQK